jgi:hypothetical protein
MQYLQRHKNHRRAETVGRILTIPPPHPPYAKGKEILGNLFKPEDGHKGPERATAVMAAKNKLNSLTLAALACLGANIVSAHPCLL